METCDLPAGEQMIYKLIAEWEENSVVSNLQIAALLDAWPSPTLDFHHGLE